MVVSKINNSPKPGKKILIVTCQPLLSSDRPTTGGSIRSHCLGQALTEAGHQVTFSIPRQYAVKRDVSNNSLAPPHNVTDIHDIIKETKAEIVLFANWGLACESRECDIPMVIDMNGSLVLENHYRNRNIQFSDSMAKLATLAKVDFIIAGSRAQKAYLTAWCLMAGIDPDSLSIGVVPFSLNPEIPAGQLSNEAQFILAGYDWPWLDAKAAVQTVAEEMERCQCGSLHLYSSSPPYSDIIEGEDSSSDLSGDLQLVDMTRLIRHKPVSFSRLTKRLTQSTVALDLWHKNPERDLAFPSRTVAYLWAGLPVISCDHGELQTMIKQYNAGWVIDYNDLEALKKLTRRIVEGDIDMSQYRKNARKLFADHLSWNKTIADLDNFCRHPYYNRSVSPIVSRYTYLQDLADRLQNQVIKREEKIIRVDKAEECELMGMIHRRPKGLRMIMSLTFRRRKLRRMIIGTPVLVYLTVLTLVGQSLHLFWIRRNGH